MQDAGVVLEDPRVGQADGVLDELLVAAEAAEHRERERQDDEPSTTNATSVQAERGRGAAGTLERGVGRLGDGRADRHDRAMSANETSPL